MAVKLEHFNTIVKRVVYASVPVYGISGAEEGGMGTITRTGVGRARVAPPASPGARPFVECPAVWCSVSQTLYASYNRTKVY